LNSTISQVIDQLSAWSGANGWVGRIFIVVLLALALDLIQRVVLKRLAHKFKHTSNPWDDALIHALQRPLTLLIWVLGLTFAADIAGHESTSSLFNAVEPLRIIGVISALSWFLVRLIANFQQNLVEIGLAQDENYDRSTVEAIGKLIRLSVIITAALVMLQTLGFSISGVLAFGGVGGIAIGFAAKDLLANFFGGLMIYLDRPFFVGDWIKSPDRSIEGTVEDIGWRLTRIRSFDKRPIYVPNSTFANIAVVNPSRMTHRRIYETIGVRYDDIDKLEKITSDVRAMLLNHPEIDTTQTLMVNFNSFAASSLDFFVYTFTKTTNWVKFHQVKQDVLFKISAIIAQHGAEIAFPTSTVQVPEGIRLHPLDIQKNGAE
jgi:MscS family membrane protein